MIEKQFHIKVNFKPLSENIDEFLDFRKLNGLAYSTIKSGYYHLKKFFEHAKTDIVTLENVKQFLKSLDVSNTHYNNIICTLRLYSRFLVDMQVIDSNDFISSFKLKKNTTTIDRKYFNEAEIESFLKELLKQKIALFIYWICWFGFHWGIRPKEMCMLELDDINTTEWYIHLRPEITKTKEESWLPIPNALLRKFNDLLAWRELQNTTSKRLFVNTQGNPVTENTLQNHLLRIKKLVNKSFIYYHCRYTCAWKAYDMTDDIYFAAQILRHSNINTTKKYLQIQKKERLTHMRKKMDTLYTNENVKTKVNTS